MNYYEEDYNTYTDVKNNIFVGSFFKCIVCVETIDKNNFPEQQKEEAKLKVFNGMGFDSAQEYLNSYPGKFLISSQECRAAYLSYPFTEDSLKNHINKNTGNVEMFNLINYFIEHNNLFFKRGMLEDILSGNHNFFFIVQPTVHELLETASVKKDFVDNLWICSDWKET